MNGKALMSLGKAIILLLKSRMRIKGGMLLDCSIRERDAITTRQFW